MRTLIRNLCIVEEFIFVFSTSRISGFAFRLSVFSTALFALTGIGSRAGAQTAPQLLPYTSKLIAGGGAALNAGKCPVTGVTATDTYGDGCLATEIVLTSPRYAVADHLGNIFFSDYTASLIRRVDAVTGIVTLVAGGPSTSPTTGKTCGANVALDNKGDGCLATAVNLYDPVDLKFATNGDLYFVESGNADVRKITATGGYITTTGVISLVVGNDALKTSGYATNQGSSSGNITVGPGSTTSLLDFPAGIDFDAAGNLYIADEGNEALEVVNLTAATETIQTVSVPPGTIAKFAGYGNYLGGVTNVECPNAVYVSSKVRGGCDYGTYSNTTATPAVTSFLDAPYGIALDPSGNVYFANEYIQGTGKIAAGSLTNYAGINGSVTQYTAKVPLVRGTAGSFSIGSNFGIAADTSANVYITDNLNGVIWRVDAVGKAMYPVAGTIGSICTTTQGASDTYGDGCPATQATFGKSGTSYSSAGVYGVSVDAYSDLFVGDSVTNLIREVASGTQFGNVGATQTNLIDIHFGPADGPASTGAYTLAPVGAANFTLGTATCTTNNDNNANIGNTTDCILPVTANPTTTGAFSGTLQVVSMLGGTGAFTLNGNYVQSPTTRTVVSAVAAGVGSCSGSAVYPTTSTVTLTAKITANGPAAPTGTIIFSANGTALAPTTGTAITNIGTVSAPVYGVIMTYTFPTAAAYSITATYSGDGYFQTSTTAVPAKFSTSLPGFSMSASGATLQSTVAAGQTALYSFNLAQNVYTGTVSFSCSGLPAYASCVFNPATITASGCSTTSLIALSILTQQATPVATTAGIGSGRWQVIGVFAGLTFALLVGIRRRRVGLRYGHIWMSLALLMAASSLVACGKGASSLGTPAGSSTVTITASGSGNTTTFTVPLTVTAY
jgi:hypothetical protein